MKIGNLIEIEKPYFGIDKDYKITYNKDEITREDFYYVEYATLSDIKYLINQGVTVFYYPNPDSINGLWNHITSETDTFNGGLGSGVPRKYDYRIVAMEIKNVSKLN
ncbi:MAG TPA: hypothetical protein PLO94_11050 [Chitinophagales bacterium]|nr:hypothetical protein [Chitinophagales bacterium]